MEKILLRKKRKMHLTESLSKVRFITKKIQRLALSVLFFCDKSGALPRGGGVKALRKGTLPSPGRGHPCHRSGIGGLLLRRGYGQQMRFFGLPADVLSFQLQCVPPSAELAMLGLLNGNTFR